jgi:uncharacterized membrane protein
MSEPILFGLPITTVFLYFIFYSFIGWALETLYCSLVEKRFVVRGFLLGPICPIYGTGALMMVFFFSRYTSHLVYFYVVATVVMSAWEYFVGWLLEVTTHMKYWDYSHHKFNISGRISLFICLWWGVLAYVAVFHVHPEVEELFALIPAWLRYTLAGSAGTLLVVDTVTTIRKLALTAKVLTKLEEVSGELRLQVALGKAELGERWDTAVDSLSPELIERLGEARGNVSRNLDDMAELLRNRRNELVDQAERYSRRFRRRYSHITSNRFAPDFSDVKAAGERLKEALQKSRRERKAAKMTEK